MLIGVKVKDNSWKYSMRRIVPDFVYIQETFSKEYMKKNKKKIMSSLKRLSRLPHRVSKDKMTYLSKSDPMTKEALIKLKENYKAAYENIKLNNISAARYTAKNAANYCFQCHGFGGSKTQLGSLLKSTTFDSQITKGRTFFALRDYDQALKVYANMFNSKNHPELNRWNKDKTLVDFIKAALSSSSDKSIATRLEPVLRLNSNTVIAGHYDELKKITNKYKKLDITIPNERLKIAEEISESSNDFSSFQNNEFYIAAAIASFMYHSSLRYIKNRKKLSQTYYRLGSLYSEMNDMNTFLLPGFYFENCIRTAPFTKLSVTCYNALSKEIFMGWSGSSGVHIPEYEKIRLRDLRKLTPKTNYNKKF
jgi:hypothetical protein